MTALKPIESRNVRAVASERYPSNLVCAHPECNERVALRPDGSPTVHHVFPRSLIKSDSYFVCISETEIEMLDEPIPHAVGLCGSGTTGHHGDVEEHRAWIKYEDGDFVWYDRCAPGEEGDEWKSLGPLNPQPGSREGRPKRKKLKGDERRKRKVISIRVPDDEEDGGAVWDETLDEVKDRLVREGLKDRPEDLSVYVALIAALRDWLNGLTHV